MFSLRHSSKTTRSSNKSKSGTPLDLKQAALKEREALLRKQAADLNRLIEEAPRLREEQTRRRREQLASDTRLSRTAVIDKRPYRATITADREFGYRRLRSEKRDGKWLFIFLCVVLAAILVWFYQTFMVL